MILEKINIIDPFIQINEVAFVDGKILFEAGKDLKIITSIKGNGYKTTQHTCRYETYKNIFISNRIILRAIAKQWLCFYQ